MLRPCTLNEDNVGRTGPAQCGCAERTNPAGNDQTYSRIWVQLPILVRVEKTGPADCRFTLGGQTLFGEAVYYVVARRIFPPVPVPWIRVRCSGIDCSCLAAFPTRVHV